MSKKVNIDFKEFESDMNVLRNKNDEVNDTINGLGKLFGDFDGKVVSLLFSLMKDLIEFTQKKYNAYDWIEWHIYENDFGKNKLEASKGKNKMKKIISIEDLWRVIDD